MSDLLQWLSIGFLVLVGLWMVVGHLPSPSRARGADLSPDERAGTVLYWRPGCRYCMRLRTRLRLARADYVEVNIWKHPDAAAFVRSVNDGNETVPTVTVGELTMTNPSWAELKRARTA